MSNIVHLTDDDFERHISESGLPVLVDFYGPQCPPCEKLVPIFQELAEEYSERVVFAKLDASENTNASTQMNIRGTPTLILFQDGCVSDTIIGLRPKQELREWLDSAL